MKEKMSLSSEVNAQATRKKVSIGQSYGSAWIEIPKDFSSSLPKRFLGMLDHDNFVISNGGSNIRVRASIVLPCCVPFRPPYHYSNVRNL